MLSNTTFYTQATYNFIMLYHLKMRWRPIWTDFVWYYSTNLVAIHISILLQG